MEAYFAQSLAQAAYTIAQRPRPVKKKKILTCPHIVNTVPIIFVVFGLETNLLILASGVLQHLAQFDGLRPRKTRPLIDSLLNEPHGSLSAVVVVQFFMIMFFISWILAIRTPPGAPDQSWRGSKASCQHKLGTCREFKHEVHSKLQETMQTLCKGGSASFTSQQLSEWFKSHSTEVLAAAQSIKHRWCKHCQAWKPDRTHHSNRLDQCVLRMDHVCPWINNVVGFRNYKYFFLMLFYGIVLLFAYVVTAILLLIHIATIKQKHIVRLPFLAVPVGGAWDFWAAQAFFIVFCLVLIVPLSFYWIFHCYLTAAGLSSIEKKERSSNTQTRRVGSSKHREEELYARSPWDLGFWKNISCMLGKYFLLWPIPISTGLGLNKEDAGAVYQIRAGHPMEFKDWDVSESETKTA